jgi:HAMP domain-containing protein/signal transduction histidine kinase/CheY-like chemotaxis protein
VNGMANNLTSQVRNIAEVTTAVAKGDLTKKITVDAKGEVLELRNTINVMVDQLTSFAGEVTRVAREVGTDGILGGQAKVQDVSGTWKDLTDNVNGMANNLTSQVRNIAEVTTAVATGDLTKKITVDAKGEVLELKETINVMVDQLNAFSSEVTRVAREVGTDGILGGQAKVQDVSGTWKDLTDNVNGMANNLTSQVRNIAEVTTAVATGDLTKKITVDAKGEVLELKETINVMVDQLNAFSSEVTRVAREVGTDGILGGQAKVQDVSGTWKDLTDNVNGMANNLTSQVRNIAEVTTAVAKGDLTKKITVDVKGEVLELKNTINVMVDKLTSFAGEVTRVAREVGTDGKLGGQANVKGVSGTWKDLTDNVNGMANNLTSQVRNIAEVTTAVAKGDLTKKITVDAKGEVLELRNTINVMVDQLTSFAGEVTRVAREVGTDGKLGGQANVKGVSGTWKDLTDNVNGMANNLTSQVRNIAEVTTAVAKGDLTKKITVDARGEVLELRNTINVMVDQLNAFSSEVTRVAREVGTDGILGGQAKVQDVSGTWKDLTDNVNGMANNLTSQVRNIAEVTTAVAKGDLTKKITVDAKGEVLELKETINVMVDQLNAFSSEVTRVAREVGTDGILGGQAKVKGVSGTWKDLTTNVNLLAENLTTQVRAIATVTTAVTKGDLTSTVEVDARGEVEELKNNINEMIRNLKDTTIKNEEQDWLKTNIAKFTRMFQGQRDMKTLGTILLSELAPLIKIHQSVFYVIEMEGKDLKQLYLAASYAHGKKRSLSEKLELGEGLIGQCAVEKQKILLKDIPANYIPISSGLGEAKPLNILIIPILFENVTKGVIELASFDEFTPIQQSFLDQLNDSLGSVVNSIQINLTTAELLSKSMSLTSELGTQKQELKTSNEELEEKAYLLENQKVELQEKNLEIEHAKIVVEEKANQLAITSKYKSEFLSNMSHELRTPLNSILLLSHLLYENKNNILGEKEIEYSKNINSAGNNLLSLISEILDLAKIESGKVDLDIAYIDMNLIISNIHSMFGEIAKNNGIQFDITFPKDQEKYLFHSDIQRLEQILKNLLSNAFKFTEKGGKVRLDINVIPTPYTLKNDSLKKLKQVLCFSVIDTGIGIPKDKQHLVFEAFQQADGSTKRVYGGTGLGLSISRELCFVLGGEIQLKSTKGKGSIFSLYLPLQINVAEQIEKQEIIKPIQLLDGQLATASKDFNQAANYISTASDDRFVFTSNSKKNLCLIIEEDEILSATLLRFIRELGCYGIIASTGIEGLSLARFYKPHIILLDYKMSILRGEKVLSHLKNSSELRHIPVQIISDNNPKKEGNNFHYFGFIKKPFTKNSFVTTFVGITKYLNKKKRHLLIVEDKKRKNNDIIDFIGDHDLTVYSAFTSADAVAKMNKEEIDCVIVDLGMQNRSGFDFIEKIKKTVGPTIIRIIAYTAKDLSKVESNRLTKCSDNVILKIVNSYEHLLRESVLLLHRKQIDLSEEKQQILRIMYNTEEILKNKKVLLVDDDMRNIYSLSHSLEDQVLEIITAENGKDAINILYKNQDVDIILMDVMMPEMDGYDTTRAIRKIRQFDSVPIVGLTAKAMKGDREKCIEAGMFDYISKPLKIEELLSLMRLWLIK